MKSMMIAVMLIISTISYSQLGYINSRTWLYEFSKSESHPNKWLPPVPYSSRNKTFSIYFAKNGNWVFVGNILASFQAARGGMYFKSGYRVAYGLKDEKPKEIIFKTKEWKVD